MIHSRSSRTGSGPIGWYTSSVIPAAAVASPCGQRAGGARPCQGRDGVCGHEGSVAVVDARQVLLVQEQVSLRRVDGVDGCAPLGASGQGVDEGAVHATVHVAEVGRDGDGRPGSGDRTLVAGSLAFGEHGPEREHRRTCETGAVRERRGDPVAELACDRVALGAVGTDQERNTDRARWRPAFRMQHPARLPVDVDGLPCEQGLQRLDVVAHGAPTHRGLAHGHAPREPRTDRDRHTAGGEVDEARDRGGVDHHMA